MAEAVENSEAATDKYSQAVGDSRQPTIISTAHQADVSRQQAQTGIRLQQLAERVTQLVGPLADEAQSLAAERQAILDEIDELQVAVAALAERAQGLAAMIDQHAGSQDTFHRHVAATFEPLTSLPVACSNAPRTLDSLIDDASHVIIEAEKVASSF